MIKSIGEAKIRTSTQTSWTPEPIWISFQIYRYDHAGSRYVNFVHNFLLSMQSVRQKHGLISLIVACLATVTESTMGVQVRSASEDIPVSVQRPFIEDSTETAPQVANWYRRAHQRRRRADVGGDAGRTARQRRRTRMGADPPRGTQGRSPHHRACHQLQQSADGAENHWRRRCHAFTHRRHGETISS